jgi:ring-1,2-phenylacetyl-CoA epoxidase subunit PaaD
MVKQPDDLVAAVWSALATVRDPEIPPCAITDLGIVEAVRVGPGAVEVDLLPTFAGCPALDIIREDVVTAVSAVAGETTVQVRFVNAPAWTSDRITPAGREAMRTYGLTPPARGSNGPVLVPVETLARGGENATAAACPFCGSRETVRESAFGPTLCRATHYCRACRNPFEAFKPKVAGAAG